MNGHLLLRKYLGGLRLVRLGLSLSSRRWLLIWLWWAWALWLAWIRLRPVCLRALGDLLLSRGLRLSRLGLGRLLLLLLWLCWPSLLLLLLLGLLLLGLLLGLLLLLLLGLLLGLLLSLLLSMLGLLHL